MFKRLPAEVTTRRRPAEKGSFGPTEAADATVDLEQVIQRKPEGRAKWLAKALAQAEEGRLEPQVLYDIVTAQRFAEDLTDKVGRKMFRALHSHLAVFSSKQRKYLEKECSLARKYAATAFNGGQKEDEGAPVNPADAGKAMEEMMSRVQAFVTQKQSDLLKQSEVKGAAADDGPGAAAAEEPAAAAAEAADAAADGAGAAGKSGAGGSTGSSPTRTKEPAKDKEKAKEREKDKERDKDKSKGKDDKDKSRRRKASSSSRRSSSSGRRAKKGKSRDRKPTNTKRKARRDSSSKSSSSSGKQDKKKRRR